MATIPKARMVALGGKNFGGAPEVFFPITGSQTGILAGDLGGFSAGYLDPDAANTDPADALVVALNEIPNTGLAAGTPILTTLCLPGLLYEGSVNSTTAAASWGGYGGAVDDSSIGVCVDVAEATAANYVFRIVSFPGGTGATSTFVTSPFVSEAATSETAGASNQPYASTKGIPGDTSPRVIVVFSADKLAFGTF